MPTFDVGDTVHAISSKTRTDRIVVAIQPVPNNLATELDKFERGERRTRPRDYPVIVTRALRDGKPFGPEHYSHPDNLIAITTLIVEES